MIALLKPQKEIISEFYAKKPTKVVFDKTERDELWKIATKRKNLDFTLLEKKCPALAHQIKRSYETHDNIQSAVFSECIYAQTLANMFDLTLFVNCFENVSFIPEEVAEILKSYSLVARYAYSTPDKKRMLIEAGGCGGIDSVLITVFDKSIYTIEFKESASKSSEPDLPKYSENGNLKNIDKFLLKYPQFEMMLKEQANLNFFAVMGHNVNDFSAESVQYAVNNNYSGKKFADVICTEDKKGYFVMMPANQVSLWAELVGEIRPSGRNHYKVWTKIRLKDFLYEICVSWYNDFVTVKKSKLEPRKERGGDGKISGYKINPLFFVYEKDYKDNGDAITFDVSKVQQLRPTITAKMFFKMLEYEKVKEYYMKEIIQ